MTTWEGLTPDQRAVLDLVDQLGAGWQPRGDGAEERIARARSDLADSGLWGLGLPESDGGGGADFVTTRLVIAQVAGHWPALGLAMAHLHAAGVALIDDARLAAAVAGTVWLAVAEIATVVDGDEPIPPVLANIGGWSCDLVLVGRSTCAFVASDLAAFSPPKRTTGLDGLARVQVTELPDAVRTLYGADTVRAALYGGVLAVTTGLLRAAWCHAREYADARIQFGAALSALPTMREQVAALRGHATMLLASAICPNSSDSDLAAVLRGNLDIAVDAAGVAAGCLGGYGYLEEYPLAGLFRDAVSLRASASPRLPA